MLREEIWLETGYRTGMPVFVDFFIQPFLLQEAPKAYLLLFLFYLGLFVPSKNLYIFSVQILLIYHFLVIIIRISHLNNLIFDVLNRIRKVEWFRCRCECAFSLW